MQQSAQMKIEHREKEAQELRQAMFYLTVIIFRLDKTHNKPHKQVLFPSSAYTFSVRVYCILVFVLFH